MPHGHEHVHGGMAGNADPRAMRRPTARPDPADAPILRAAGATEIASLSGAGAPPARATSARTRRRRRWRAGPAGADVAGLAGPAGRRLQLLRRLRGGGRVRRRRAARPMPATWLCDQLHLVLARSELAVVAKAWAAWRRGDDAERRPRSTPGSGAPARSSECAAADAADGALARRLAGAAPMRADPRLGAARPRSSPSPTWPVAFALAAVARRRSAARGAARLRLRLGREHGAGGDQVDAARPERRAAHPRRPRRRDPGGGRSCGPA